MKNAIRAARRRAHEPAGKTVTLSRNAWFILSRLAEKEGGTMSEVIEHHLGHAPLSYGEGEEEG